MRFREGLATIPSLCTAGRYYGSDVVVQCSVKCGLGSVKCGLGGSVYGVFVEFCWHSFLAKTAMPNNGQELCGQATICPTVHPVIPVFNLLL